MGRPHQDKSTKTGRKPRLDYWRTKNRLVRLIVPTASILILTGLGVYFLAFSHAASPFVSSEAEKGSLQGSAAITQDPSASGGEAVTFGGNPSGGSCAPSGQCAPGSIAGYNQVFETNFPGTVPVGAFSGCESDSSASQTYCTGLQSYGAYYNDWWAYPSGWPDTAEECVEGSSSCPNGTTFHPPTGGLYEPQEAVSVSGSAMHINESAPAAGGPNIVATVVPRACMSLTDGIYTERFDVVTADPGFKSAHLLIGGTTAYYEVDYPENDYSQNIYAYGHLNNSNTSFNSNVAWTSGWHTTEIVWTSKSFTFYMDGQQIGTTSTNIPNSPLAWIIQNESSINGPYASPGAKAELDLAWVACYSPSS